MEKNMQAVNPQPRRFYDDGKCLFFAKMVVRLPDEDSGLSHNIVRLENSRMGKGKIKRRTALRITNRANDSWIIRYSMGNGGTVKGLNKDCVALDYDGIKELDVEYKQECSLSVREASWWDVTKWFWNYKDLNVKYSYRLGLVGFVLGMISLVDLIANVIHSFF